MQLQTPQTLYATLNAGSARGLGSSAEDIVVPEARMIITPDEHGQKTNHVSDFRVVVVRHRVFKGFEEILLEFEVW